MMRQRGDFTCSRTLNEAYYYGSDWRSGGTRRGRYGRTLLSAVVLAG